MTPETLAALKQGGLVLTVNRRLARHIQQQFGEAQLAEGHGVWPTPKVAAWEDWLDALWQRIEHEPSLTLLQSHQLSALWEDVVKRSTSAGQLLNPANTAAMAIKAYNLLKQWNLGLDAVSDSDHPDVQAFAQWMRDYQQRCQQQGWLDGHARLALLVDAIEGGDLPLPGQIVWVGFDSLTPQQRRVMAALHRAGCRGSEESHASPQGQASCRPCSDAMGELESAAAWALQLQKQNSNHRIAIVVPDLAGGRSDVMRIFDEALCPDTVLKLTDEFTRPYNLSCGMPLAESPPIAVALALLSLANAPLELAALGRLIQSPYLAGGESELGARALLDRHLRELGDARYSLANMARLAAAERLSCPQLAASFKAMVDTKATLPRRQCPSAWVASLRALLKAGGWPGERPLSSAEYQAVEVWQGLLGKFSSLDIVVGEVGFSDAVNHLKQMAADHPFQLKTPEAQVQILGMLEAAGLDFDYLWITGMHDGVWPPAPRPNPFLPMSLQRLQEMPHASAERELHFAQELTQRLLASAGEVVVSYPQRDGDSDLRPSPLIVALAQSDSDIPDVQMSRWQIFQSRTLEPLQDWRGSTLSANGAQAVNVSGGSGIFTDQAACPFRAFAYRRLGARPLPEVVSGLSPAQRGSILHTILEKFWLDLQGQADLLAMDESALNDRVAGVVASVLAQEARRQPQRFTERFTALEQERLTQLLQRWLAVEKQRQPFTLVSSEERRRVCIGGLAVDIKADRIDRLDNDGRELIIDYKTSDRKAKTWFGERPDEPQLPLYAVTHARPVAGLAFATLRPDGCGLEGVSDGVEVGKGVTDIEQKKGADETDWERQLERWHKVLEKLANDFRTGRAEVDPKEINTSCTYCGLEGLCRVGELGE